MDSHKVNCERQKVENTILAKSTSQQKDSGESFHIGGKIN